MRVTLHGNLQRTSCLCPRHEDYMGRSLATPIVNLRTECRRVANVTPHPLYPQGKTTVPSDRSAGLHVSEKRKHYACPVRNSFSPAYSQCRLRSLCSHGM